MKIAVIFASVEGQTRKIARFVEAELTQAGHDVETFDVDAATPPSFNGVDAVIAAAPVHQRRHPDSFEATLVAFSEALARIPTLMLSVSLSAAFAEGHEEAQDYLDEMKMRTKFSPRREALVAGAVRIGRYDYFAMQVVKLVVMRGRDFDPSAGDHEFTDWDGLKTLLKSFVGQVESG